MPARPCTTRQRRGAGRRRPLPASLARLLRSAALARRLRAALAMAAYSKFLTARHSAIAGAAAACALLCLLNKRRAAAQHG